VRWQAYGVNFSSLVFAGRDGRDGLAAAGLAIMLSNVTMEAVAWGMLTALETLGAQAFGAGNFRRVGVVTQRAAVVLAVAAVPVASLWINVQPLLLALRQPPAVAALMQRYMTVLVCGLVPYFGFETLRRFLQVQQVVSPMLVATCVGDAVHPLLCLVLHDTAGLGLVGVAWATVTTSWIMLFTLLGHLVWFRPHHPGTWPGFSRDALVDIRPFLALAVPGTVMVLLEW
jgi:MATE family multidrug resistance protein